MAARIAARYVARRLSSGGKVLSEEEKAAENVYIKVLSPWSDPSDLSGLIFFIFIHFNLSLTADGLVSYEFFATRVSLLPAEFDI